jgi:hypothetical protein
MHVFMMSVRAASSWFAYASGSAVRGVVAKALLKLANPRQILQAAVHMLVHAGRHRVVAATAAPPPW